MSHFLDFETQITDPIALGKALIRVGNPHQTKMTVWNEKHIEVHEKAQHLYGYQNDVREQTAHVIVRRCHVGSASNDFGFVRDEKGFYHAIISEYDRNCGFKPEWLTKLLTYYNVEKSKMELDAKGIEYVEDKDKEGRMRLCAQFKTTESTVRVGIKVGIRS